MGFNDPPVLSSTPVEEGREEEYLLEQLSYGVGFPYTLCFRLWGLADSHPDTTGICPFTCKEAFSPSRVPKSRGQWCHRQSQSLVVADERGDPPSDATAATTFVSPLPDPPPHLDHPPAADSDAHSVPAEQPHPAGARHGAAPGGRGFHF
ncbi:hypothetical protein CYMTET_26915 [Cymbomonas tetramitiformis]|uniref:Uncharacterized protein n=1 Tax=Cymbomonas tetramitiformis TaxID=36881 RepID=A0AAE0KXR6_9CHLO|nr:hypothetical protein CYMTET_26915 [Cymbomonas tetramitiformis]